MEEFRRSETHSFTRFFDLRLGKASMLKCPLALVNFSRGGLIASRFWVNIRLGSEILQTNISVAIS